MVYKLAKQVGEELQRVGVKLATAESCTGGWIAQEVTAVPGSSEWFDCGFVTYSNAAKKRMLGVREETLVAHGAVSEAVVLEMAEGAVRESDASLSVAISGVAGPDGGSAEKPVGTVWMAWALCGETTKSNLYRFKGDRESVRQQAVNQALKGILDCLSKRSLQS